MSLDRRRPSTPIRLGRGRRWVLYGLTAVLLASGLAWWLVHERADPEALPSPIEPWMMRLHGAAAMLAIFALGTLLFDHMLQAWRRGRNRLSGGLLAGAWLLLGLSGYGLYYLGGEGPRRATEWLHWGFGAALPLALCMHLVVGRRSRRTGRA